MRNRGYLGGVSFRDVVHESGEPLLDPVLFEKAQALLAERGEGYDRRFADAHPEYLLTGLITCSRCHRCYVEAAAHGKRHRYRYYVCWTAQRYGKDASGAERIRADALEDAVLSALAELYSDPDLITRAILAHQAPPTSLSADTTTSWQPPTPKWPRPKPRSSAICTPSRPAL